jgi:cobaltochelatase CobS
MRKPSLRTQLKELRHNSKCKVCGARLVEGDKAWYAKGAGRKCRECGPHDEFDDKRFLDRRSEKKKEAASLAGEATSDRQENNNPKRHQGDAMITATQDVSREDGSHQEVFRGLAHAIGEFIDTDARIDEGEVRRIVSEEVEKATLPRPIEVRMPDREPVKLERVHCQFEELMKLVSEGRQNLLMVGPAGSGKTTLAKNVAQALQVEFGFISLSAGVTETHLFGRMLPQADGTWAYQESVFVRIYRNGGVFLFDEIDAADPNVMVSVNAALANGELCNPVTGEVVQRSDKCIIVGAANTWGRGGDYQYVGRNALDAATMDRFVLATLHVQYDTKLEEELVRNMLDSEQAEKLLDWIKRLRESISRNRMRRIASTRLVINAATAMTAGRRLEDVAAQYQIDWSQDEKAKAPAA